MFKEELEQILTDHRIKWLNMLSELNDELISVPEMLDVKANIIEEALTSIINLVDKEVAEYQRLYIDAVEIGLKGVGLSLNEKEWLDLIAVLRESQKTAQQAIIRGNNETKNTHRV
jgi:hypothetical protein